MKPDRWEKSAARENARRDARAPLFAHAGLVPHTTGAAQQAKVDRAQRETEERFAAHLERQLRKIDMMRQDLLALAGPDMLAAFDERRKAWPKSPAYELDGLSEELQRVTGKTPLEVFETYKEHPRVGEQLRVEDVPGLEIAVDDDAAEHEAEAAEEAAGRTERAR